MVQSVSPFLFAIGFLANLAATRFAGFFFPDEIYFSFSAFLFDTRDINKPLALAGKLMVPFVVSFVLVFCMNGFVRARQVVDDRPSPVAAMLANQAALSFATAGFATAFLLAWPYILLWDMLIDPSLAQYRLPFLLAYFAYFVATGYFSLAGANTALALAAPRPEGKPFSLATLSESRFTKPLLDGLTGSLSALVAAYVGTAAG